MKETGSVVPITKIEFGRDAQVAENNGDDILPNIEEHPETSLPRIAAMYPEISPTSIWISIVYKESLYPFHFQKTHGMLERDFAAPVQFSRWLKNKSKSTFFSQILFSDKAIFTTDGSVHMHNSHHCSYVDDNSLITRKTKH